MKHFLFLFMSLASISAAAQSVNFTRGIGVYPGDKQESMAPLSAIDPQYKNIALMRAAYHSSAKDRNLTAQLITDGIISDREPTYLDVSLSNVSIGQRDREKTIDGNIHSSNYIKGEKGYIQYDWHSMSVHMDKITIHSEIAFFEHQAQQGYRISILASKDGTKWNIIGEDYGKSLPGEATDQKVSSDPNKKEATEKLPLRLVNLAISVKEGNYQHIRVQISMPGCAYWRIYENKFYHKASLQEVLPSYHFNSTWCSNGGGKQWVYVDLGHSADFDHIRLHWIKKPLVGKIQVSENAQEWKNVATLPTKSSLMQEISCKGKGRFVRILMEKPDKAGYYALSELEVMGKGGILFKPCEAQPISNGKYSLNGGNWLLKRKGEKHGILATVPATVLASYMNIGAVPDPLYANNLQYISDSYFNSNFIYEREFTVPKSFKDKKIHLNLDGINWKANISINGQKVGKTDGAFIRGNFDITNYLHAGVNQLTIEVIHNAHIGSIKVKNETSTDLNGGILGADNPTFHASIGWDWITTVPGREVGIWNDVYLSCNAGISLKDPLLTTQLSGQEQLATITPSVIVSNENPTTEDIKLIGWIGDIKFEQNVTILPNSVKQVSFAPDAFTQLKQQKLNLWWPNGYGEPYLYEAGFCIEKAGINSDSIHYKAGIREVSYKNIDNDTQIYINGKRITPLGGNWGFSEMNLNYRKREYDIAVRYHKEMNYNMIRNWVGQIGDEEFYEACDKYGILVWQDFWLANPWDGPDPYDEKMFMDNAFDYIQRIRNHPSIVIYVGRNEGYPPQSLDKQLKTLVKEQHPQLGYISSSADDGVSGHGPYCALTTKEYFKNQSHKLHSERGMPNVPTIESLNRMLAPQDLWPQNEQWGKHDYTLEGAQGGATFNDIVNKHFGHPKNAKQFSEWAQWVNYDGYRAMYESAEQERKGLLIWMSHSCWPSMVWQTYDYYFEPTAAYFGVKKACEPIHIQYNPLKKNVQLVCLDIPMDISTLTAIAQTLNIKGEVINEQQKAVKAIADSTMDITPITTLTEPITFVKLCLKREGKIISDNFYAIGKETDNLLALNSLPKATLIQDIQTKEEGEDYKLIVTLHNKSNTPAMMIRLNLKGNDGEQILPVIYDDNYFSLMPNESKTISITYHKQDGRGTTPTVEITGFNL